MAKPAVVAPQTRAEEELLLIRLPEDIVPLDSIKFRPITFCLNRPNRSSRSQFYLLILLLLLLLLLIMIILGNNQPRTIIISSCLPLCIGRPLQVSDQQPVISLALVALAGFISRAPPAEEEGGQ